MFSVRKGRVPSSCPSGFQGRYTVVQGDTMYLIAQRLGIPLQDLINANPHITNPNLIYPGDVLCIPSELVFPCCVILNPVQTTPPVPPSALGVALIRQINTGHSLSILAVGLRPPQDYGNFDIYEGFISIPDIGGFGFRLYPTPENPSAWAGTLNIGPFLTTSTLVQVRVANTQTGFSGKVVLKESLKGCTIDCSC